MWSFRYLKRFFEPRICITIYVLFEYSGFSCFNIKDALMYALGPCFIIANM